MGFLICLVLLSHHHIEFQNISSLEKELYSLVVIPHFLIYPISAFHKSSPFYTYEFLWSYGLIRQMIKWSFVTFFLYI